MLFISRKIGEAIIINDGIRIQVESVQGKSVKLSFACPAGTVVLRQEIHDRIRAENQAAEASAAFIKETLTHES